MKRTVLMAALVLLPLCAWAQEPERLDSVVVSTTRAGEHTPVAYSSLNKAELRSASPANSLPMTLQLLPSVVTYNEGGTGLGNSSMTIRGVKGSQINVTLNGITLNDAESQEVFWVNIPALGSMLSHVQVQRGLGTSANGAGAFGASINMNTDFVGKRPSGEVSMGGGSYGTFLASVYGSTGLSPDGFYGSVSYNRGTTEGYIRNGFVQSHSAFVTLGWLGGRNSVRLTWLMGKQRSGITWDGISLEQYEKDRRYNEAGEYEDAFGNIHYYDNQTDNYLQHHLQLNWTHAFTGRWSWSNTFNYTHGAGYDEYYKAGKKLVNYGYPESGRSDMTYRKEMGNDLFVLNSDLRYRREQLDVTVGLNLSHYTGRHWGTLLWAQTLGDGYDYAALNAKDPWYRNTGLKWDGGLFARAEYRPLEALTVYADLQGRLISYDLTGVDDDWIAYGKSEADRLNYKRFWPFFNPRAGVTGQWGAHKAFFSAAFGHREPGRGDIKENVKGEMADIRPEKMLDVELGYQLHLPKVTASVNLYAMEYWDMLLETGRLSSSGYAIKENLPRAWRRGVEVAAAWKPVDWVRLDGNLTLSMNRIGGHTEYVAAYEYETEPEYVEEQLPSEQIVYGATPMLLSPSVVAMGRMEVKPYRNIALTLSAKYVGKQYLDNTGREDFSVPSILTADLSASWALSFGGKTLTLSAYVNNLFNSLYYASGWRWEAYYFEKGKPHDLEKAWTGGVGVYPQAPAHFMFKASLAF